MINLTKYKAIKRPLHLILDSGHGWNTSGKRSKDESLRENQFNTMVEAKIGLLCSMAKQQGINITYSFLSPEHSDTPLKIRVEREREIYRRLKNTHLIIGISIHADAFTEPTANGTTTFINPKSKSRYFAEILQSNLIKKTKLFNRGVREVPYMIVRKTLSPFVLLEAAFMTNPKELELLKSDEFRNTNALAIFESFLEFALLYQDKF